MLKVGGCFMAGVATHPSAEPDTLVVRARFEDRELLLEEAPETYYVTDYYVKHPVVLARLARLDADALRDLLASRKADAGEGGGTQMRTRRLPRGLERLPARCGAAGTPEPDDPDPRTAVRGQRAADRGAAAVRSDRQN